MRKRGSLECKDLYEAPSDRHSFGMELRRTAYPTFFEELLAERVIDASDAIHDPRTSEFAESYLTPLGITALLDIPIRFMGRLVGVLRQEMSAERGPGCWRNSSLATPSPLLSLSL